jgi:mannosylfructose-phosphate synthase
MHTPHSIGAWKRDNMDGDPRELEQKYNFRHRIREEKTIYDECDIVLATTPPQRDILAASEYDVPTEKIRVIPPGYDDTRFFPVSLATRQSVKQQLQIDSRIVLALGRMAKNKGYDLLLQSMRPVFERVEDARLLLAVGSTEPSDDEVQQVEQLKRLAGELGIAQRVLFRDYIPDELLADYYRAGDVFALSSRYEPFGMTAVEAMACGTPTVVTTEGGLWEQVTWGLEALYANPFDPDAFGHAIAAILTYPRVRDQLARFGSQKARSRFTWTGVAQQLLRVLQDVDLMVPHDQGAGHDASLHSTPSASRCEEEEEPWKEVVRS